MNDIIDKFAYTAGLWCDGTPDSWDSNAIDEFAHMILHDVLDIIEEHRVKFNSNYIAGSQGTNLAPAAEWIASAIKAKYEIQSR